jgi:hypothetical protein
MVFQALQQFTGFSRIARRNTAVVIGGEKPGCFLLVARSAAWLSV